MLYTVQGGPSEADTDEMTLIIWEEESITVSCSHRIITSIWHWWKSAYSNTIQQERLGEIGIMWARESYAEWTFVEMWCCPGGVEKRGRVVGSRKDANKQHAWLINQGSVLNEGSCLQSLDNEMDDIISASPVWYIIRINEQHMSLSNTHLVTDDYAHRATCLILAIHVHSKLCTSMKSRCMHVYSY